MANQRVVRKSKAGVQDLILGKGQVTQQRGENEYQIDRLDVPVAVDSIAEMTALDTDDYTRARVYSDATTFVDYIYDGSVTEGIAPDDVSATGFWVESISTRHRSLNYATVALAVLDASLRVGDIVNTTEYSTGNSGGAPYVVVGAGTGTADGGLYHDVINGLQLKLSVVGAVKLSQLGNVLSASAYFFRHIVIDSNITKTGTYAIQESQVVELQADILQDDNLTCFSSTASNWKLTGNGEVRRSAGLPVALIPGSIGLSVSPTCFKYSITGNIVFRHFSQVGVLLDGGDIITGAVGRNNIDNITCVNNWDGWNILDGFPVEYVSISNSFSTDNVNVGVLLEAGNINWLGGTISGNKGGLHLRHPVAGGNPHHGMFVGTNINHNVDYQLWADKVANGHDFSGCHFYNNADPSTGRIILDNCRGINISGGTIGTVIEYIDDGHVHVGYNRIAGNKMELANSGIEPTAGNFNRKWLYVEDNFSKLGRWGQNDSANVQFLRWQGGGAQVLSGSTEYNLTTLIGDVEIDNREIFDGVNLTIPYLVGLTVSVSLDLSANGFLVGGETLFIERDAQGDDNWQLLRNVNLQPLVNSAGTRYSIDVSIPFDFGAGSKIRVRLVGMDNATTYTIAPGGHVSCISGR